MVATVGSKALKKLGCGSTCDCLRKENLKEIKIHLFDGYLLVFISEFLVCVLE